MRGAKNRRGGVRVAAGGDFWSRGAAASVGASVQPDSGTRGEPMDRGPAAASPFVDGATAVGGDRGLGSPVSAGGVESQEDGADGRTAFGRREHDGSSTEDRSSWTHARRGSCPLTLGASAASASASVRAGAIKERSPRRETEDSLVGPWPRERRRASAGSSKASSRPGWR